MIKHRLGSLFEGNSMKAGKANRRPDPGRMGRLLSPLISILSRINRESHRRVEVVLRAWPKRRMKTTQKPGNYVTAAEINHLITEMVRRRFIRLSRRIKGFDPVARKGLFFLSSDDIMLHPLSLHQNELDWSGAHFLPPTHLIFTRHHLLCPLHIIPFNQNYLRDTQWIIFREYFLQMKEEIGLVYQTLKMRRML